jgi:hypothetical protein
MLRLIVGDVASYGLAAVGTAAVVGSGIPETILSCLHVTLREEWEHHRYAIRDWVPSASPLATRAVRRSPATYCRHNS